MRNVSHCRHHFVDSFQSVKVMMSKGSHEEMWCNAGIILGMCLLGAIGDRIGRRKGSITTASIMLFGAILLTVQNGVTMKGFTVMYMISQLVFG